MPSGITASRSTDCRAKPAVSRFARRELVSAQLAARLHNSFTLRNSICEVLFLGARLKPGCR